jgi:hypothetical protein
MVENIAQCTLAGYTAQCTLAACMLQHVPQSGTSRNVPEEYVAM